MSAHQFLEHLGNSYGIGFAIATALPVIVVAWILAFSTNSIGRFYNKMNTIQKWFNWIVGGLFVAIGLYYCIIVFF